MLRSLLIQYRVDNLLVRKRLLNINFTLTSQMCQLVLQYDRPRLYLLDLPLTFFFQSIYFIDVCFSLLLDELAQFLVQCG